MRYSWNNLFSTRGTPVFSAFVLRPGFTSILASVFTPPASLTLDCCSLIACVTCGAVRTSNVCIANVLRTLFENNARTIEELLYSVIFCNSSFFYLCHFESFLSRCTKRGECLTAVNRSEAITSDIMFVIFRNNIVPLSRVSIFSPFDV